MKRWKPGLAAAVATAIAATAAETATASDC